MTEHQTKRAESAKVRRRKPSFLASETRATASFRYYMSVGRRPSLKKVGRYNGWYGAPAPGDFSSCDRWGDAMAFSLWWNFSHAVLWSRFGMLCLTRNNEIRNNELRWTSVFFAKLRKKICDKILGYECHFWSLSLECVKDFWEVYLRWS